MSNAMSIQSVNWREIIVTSIYDYSRYGYRYYPVERTVEDAMARINAVPLEWRFQLRWPFIAKFYRRMECIDALKAALEHNEVWF